MRVFHGVALEFAVAALVLYAGAAAAQDASLAVERVAARALLSRLNIGGRVAIHPLMARAGTAPPIYEAASQSRPQARSRELARDLGGVVRRLDEERDCARCVLKGIEAILTLSEPAIAGADTATITATATYNTGNTRIPTAYLTISYRLVRTGTAWKIMSEREIGAS